jgi:hypothetical protein
MSFQSCEDLFVDYFSFKENLRMLKKNYSVCRIRSSMIDK